MRKLILIEDDEKIIEALRSCQEFVLDEEDLSDDEDSVRVLIEDDRINLL